MQELINPVDKKIIEVLKANMLQTGKTYSSLTNDKIAAQIGATAIKVRDRMLRMVRRKVITSKLYQYDENGKFLNRTLQINEGY